MECIEISQALGIAKLSTRSWKDSAEILAKCFLNSEIPQSPMKYLQVPAKVEIQKTLIKDYQMKWF